MKTIPFSKRRIQICFILLIGILNFANAQEAVPFTPRLDGGNIEIRGDIIFVGNNILNRATATDPGQANTPYNGTQNNNSLWMEYIDIDSDPTTFSSSSAELNITDPSCSQVRYAGLYWAATYPNERSTDQNATFNGTPRIEDWFNIKFKIPGGSYVDLTADNAADTPGQEDDIVFDGYDYGNINDSFKDSPYICYKNVTDLVNLNADANGEYSVANVRATKGVRNGSSSAGWVLVIIYENPNETGKFISTFDGYAGLSGAVGSVDVDVNGFKTLPPGFPVRARVGVGALEGDRRITNDRLYIKANSKPTFTNLTTALNPANNFFNSTITLNGAEVPTRTPYGTNTLGTDLDIFDLNNPSNSILPNDETGATLRFTSTGDGYGSFLTMFAVEIIEPDIILEKRVEDIAGNDITGQGVNLGQILNYILTFQNIGNDDAANYTIRDVLPINVTLDESNMNLPPGVTYTYDTNTRTVLFTIPNNLVEEFDPAYSIRMRVKVAENCYDFVDACSDLIENLAYSTYQGVLNSNVITDDPSVFEFNSCGFSTPGATNFLLDDLADCNFTSTVQLCGDQVILDSGDGFDEYVWYRDENNNNEIDAADTVITDGDPDNDPSTFVVNTTGTYLVDKIVADPCKGFVEILHVERYGTTQFNPIIDYFNTLNGDADPNNDISGEIVTCSIDGSLLPKIFLCGINDTQLLQVAVADAVSLSWEQLVEGSCADAGDDCGNKNGTCVWNTVGSGSSYTANTAGKFRLVINYQNGCFSRFYFNVFQNILDVQYIANDIICTTPGNITITNLGSGYGYQLVDVANNAIVVPYSANNGPSFDITTNGVYQVGIMQLDLGIMAIDPSTGMPIEGSCEFSTPEIGIRSRDFQVAVTATSSSCNTLGSINIQVNNVEPNYEYELRIDDGTNSGDGTLLDNETAQPDNNFTFNNLNPDNYIVRVRTDDGCFYEERVTVMRDLDLELTARISQHISCREGNILMESTGGTTPHTYAIWEYVDESGTVVTSYPSVNDIPPSEYQTSQIFDIYDPGDYTFIVIDRNNCTAISNPVTIILVPDVEYTTTVEDETCFGVNDGSITYNMIRTNGYNVKYTLTYPDGTTLENSSGSFIGLGQGDYTVTLTQSKGGASCDYIEPFTIGGPMDSVTGTIALVQEYTCFQNGIIEAQNVSGGTAPYEYSIDGINFVSGPGAETFSNLTDGTYSITIRDATGCALVTNTIVIPPLNVPTDITFNATPPNCPTQTSDVTLTAVGGSGSITYEIVAPVAISNGTNNMFTNLAPDTYTFRVSDANGCFYDKNLTITPVDPITTQGTLVSNVSCFGASDGAVNFTVDGFASTYSYTINGGTAVTGQSAAIINLTGLAVGNYAISVTDESTNCTATDNVTVSGPLSALNFTFNVTPLSCATDASVAVSATGGWGGYNYEVVQPDTSVLGPQGGGIFGGLTQIGTYTIRVTDAGGCMVTDTFDITAPLNPTASIDAASDMCYDATNMTSVTIGVSGGVAPYYYNMNGGSTQTSNTFAGLTPNTYTFTVVDSNGCSDLVTVVVNPELSASATLTKDIDCTLSPDAVIGVTVNGGNPDFSYELSIDGAPYASPISLGAGIRTFNYTTNSPGTYRFRITDAQGCTTETNVIVATPADDPAITSITPTHISCFGDNSGVLDIVIDTSVGVAAYTINILETVSGTDYGTQTTGLPAGNYQITVTDDKGCYVIENQILTEPNALVPSISKTDLMCTASGNQLGTITVDASGGTATYVYEIYNADFSYTDSYDSSTGTNDHTFTGLQYGDYTVRVVDSNGCENISTVTITTGPDVLITTIGTSGCLPTSGEMLVKADTTFGTPLGTGTFYFAIYPATPWAPTNPDWHIQDGPVSDPYTYNFTGLTPGVTYTFIVFDSDTGCEYIQEATVPVSTASSLTSTIDTTTNVSCFGSMDGSVDFTFSGYVGTEVHYEVFTYVTNLPITPTPIEGTVTGLSGAPYSDSLNGIGPGEYYILFTEVGGTPAGCVSASESFVIQQSPALLEITATSINSNCSASSGSITAQARYGTAPYLFQLELASATAPNAGTWSGTNTSGYFNADTEDYIVYVKDANNCIQSVPVTIAEDPSPVISLVVTNQCATSEGNFIIQVTLDNIGVGPYFMSLDGGAFQAVNLGVVGSTFDYTGLSSGIHTVEIRDTNSCGNIASTEVYTPTSLSADTIIQPSCLGSDGRIDVAAYGGSGDYRYQLYDSAGTLLAGPQMLPSFSGLDPDTYSIYVYDQLATGCNATIDIQMEIPTVVGFSTTKTDVSCNGGSDGTISVALDPGMINPPYTYQLFDSTGVIPESLVQTSPIFTGLVANTYTVRVTSARLCTADELVLIGEPSPLGVMATNTEFACALDNSVSQLVVTATASGGTAPYMYSVDGTNFFSDNTFDITDTGSSQTITITVRDDNGCMDTTAITVQPLPEIIDVQVTQNTAITCMNPESVVVTANGGSGDYTFELLPSGSAPIQAPGAGVYSATFSLTTTGDYTFRVTDNVTACYFTSVTYRVAPYDLITVSATAMSAVSCYGDNSGSLQLNVSGYTGDYTYTVYTATGTTGITGVANTASGTVTVSGLNGGNYYVRVEENNVPLCAENSNIIQIESPMTNLTAIVDPIANVTCTNNLGEIIVNPSGGYYPYDIVLTNTTTAQVYNATDVNVIIFNSLSAGNYTVQITDANGCILNDTEILVQPTPISADITPLSTTLDCLGDSDGVVSAINVSGGEGDYQYQLNVYDPTGTTILHTSGAQSSPDFNNLKAGIYSITVSDGWECDMETVQAVILEPTEVYASLIRVSPITCLMPNAELLLTAYGGTPNYEYSVDGVTYFPMSGGNTHTFFVPAGAYRYFVRDSFGCESILSNEINEDAIAPLTVTLDTSAAVINCYGDSTAILIANADGGMGNYRYELFTDAALTNRIAGPQISNQFSNLTVGNYYVRVTSDDCIVVSDEAVIAEPMPLVVDDSFVNVSCNGDNDGSITVSLSGGSGSYQYAISPNLDKFDTVNTFTNLEPGNYTVIAQDINGCFEQLQYTIVEPSIVEVVLDTIPEICFGSEDGSISLAISGGTAPYSTSINSNADGDFVLDRTVFTNLAAGSHAIFVKDAQGCMTSLVATIDPGVILNATVTPMYECIDNSPSNSIDLVLEDVTIAADLMYGLDSTDASDFVLEPNFTNLAPGNHFITIAHTNGCMITIDFEIETIEPLVLTVEQNGINEITAVATGGSNDYVFYFNDEYYGTDNTYYITETKMHTIRVVDANGCEVMQTIFMEFIDIEIPNFFSPDGDHLNDVWRIGNIEQFPNISILIYDRYGRIVCDMGEDHLGWDGKYNGNLLPTGDYWYVVKPNGDKDDKQYVGHFTLFR